VARCAQRERDVRLLHLLVGDGWGGAERLACALARRFEIGGHAVGIEATPDCRTGARNETPFRLDAEAPPASLRGRPDRWLRWALTARRRARAFEPDVVHVHLSTPAFAAAASCVSAGMPSVWTFHLLPQADWPLDAMTRLPCAWSLRFAPKTPPPLFVGVSETDAAVLKTRCPERPVRCVVNAPPPAGPDPDPIDRAAWGDAEHRLLFVGRLEPQKGVDRLLRALASPWLASTPFRLLVVGDGPARAELESLAAGLGLRARVSFAGARPALSAIRAADLVVCPSRYEGMPLVPMEAIAEGALVVVSPIASHRELLRLVPEAWLPVEEGAWGTWLFDLLSDRARCLCLVDREAALRPRFSLDRVVAEYDALYEEARAAGAEPPAGAVSRAGSFFGRQLSQNARVACLNLSSIASAMP
jgi:glycosyltransferase involved in cell wall biosynthesis